MILAGLWHGADWTFVLWGVMHGFLILINHFWQEIKLFKMNKILSLWLTFLTVISCKINAKKFFCEYNIKLGMVEMVCRSFSTCFFP